VDTEADQRDHIIGALELDSCGHTLGISRATLGSNSAETDF
jgi:hypothetical protein